MDSPVPVPMAESLTGETRQRSLIRYGAAALALTAVTAWAFAGPVQQPAVVAANIQVDPSDAYNPVLAGEPLPDGFRQVLPRDAIRPVYDPTFLDGRDIDWPGEAQVIGVTIDGASKAYPVSFLNGRELVVDELAGIPILVSW